MALLAISLLTGCASPPPVISNDCGHRAKFYPDPGYGTRWTTRELKHQDDENTNVDKDCRGK